MNNSIYMQPVDDGLHCRKSQPYAIAKLDSLKRYLEITSTAMKNKFSTRCFLDLQAGPGKNKIANEIVFGSPLISLMLQHPFTHYFFNENDRICFNSLKARISASPLCANVQLFDLDVGSGVQDMINALPDRGQSSLNVAFLDPEGLEAPWEVVEQLASVKRMDLIINFSTSGILRNAKINPDVVDKFFGNPDWRRIWDHGGSLRRRKLIDHYLDGLKKFGYRHINEGGESEISARNRKNAEVYAIIYASKNPLGEKFWKQSANITKPPKLPGFG